MVRVNCQHYFPSKAYYLEHGDFVDTDTDKRVVCFSIESPADSTPEITIFCGDVPHSIIKLANADSDQFSLFSLYLIKTIVCSESTTTHEIVINNTPNAGNASEFVIYGDRDILSISQTVYKSGKSAKATPTEERVLVCDSPVLKCELDSNDPDPNHRKYQLVNQLSSFLPPIAVRWTWSGNSDPEELAGSHFSLHDGICVSNYLFD